MVTEASREHLGQTVTERLLVTLLGGYGMVTERLP